MSANDEFSEIDILLAEAGKAVWMDSSLCRELLALLDMTQNVEDQRDLGFNIGLLTVRDAIHSGDLVKAQAELSRLQGLHKEESSPLRRASTLILAAEIATEGGNSNLAMENIVQARSLVGEGQDDELLAEIYLATALLLKSSGDISGALRHFALASETRQAVRAFSFGDDVFFVRLMCGVGLSFLDLGDNESAGFWLHLAQGSAREVSRIDQVRALAALARIRRRCRDYEGALELLEEAQGICERHHFPFAAIDIRLELATLLTEGDDHNRALAVLDFLLDSPVIEASRPRLSQCLLLRSLVCEIMSDYHSALENYKTYHSIALSLSWDRISQIFLDGEKRFEYERYRQLAEIYRLRNVELKEKQERLEWSNRRLFAVSELGKLVTSSLDMDKVAYTVYTQLSSLVPVDAFSLAVIEEERGELDYCFILIAGQRKDRMSVPLASIESFSAHVWRSKQSLVFSDMKGPEALKALYENSATRTGEADPVVDRFAFGLETRSAVFWPLFLAGRLVAVLGVRALARNAYSDEDISLFSSLGSFIAVAVHNARNHRELLFLNRELEQEKASLERLTKKISSIANHDGLTGLPNRLLLSEFLDKALHSAARNKTRLALLFMDLDDFKPINDKHGHRVGDLALVEVANRLKGTFRASDILARVGGDEFIALTTGLVDIESAALVAQKILNLMEKPLKVSGIEARVGVSIGIALYPDDAKKGDALIQRADEAMYRVKKAKKDGYRFWNEQLR